MYSLRLLWIFVTSLWMTSVTAADQSDSGTRQECSRHHFQSFSLSGGKKVCGRLEAVPPLAYPFVKLSFQPQDLEEIQFSTDGKKVRYLTSDGEEYVADVPQKTTIYVNSPEGWRQSLPFHVEAIQSIFLGKQNKLPEIRRPQSPSEIPFTLEFKNHDRLPVTLSMMYLKIGDQNFKLSDIQEVLLDKQIEITYLKEGKPQKMILPLMKEPAHLPVRLSKKWAVTPIPWQDIQSLKLSKEGVKKASFSKKLPSPKFSFWLKRGLDSLPVFNQTTLHLAQLPQKKGKDKVAINPDLYRAYSKLLQTENAPKNYGVKGMVKIDEYQELIPRSPIDFHLMGPQTQKVAILPYAPQYKYWILQRAFWVDIHLVTNKMFARFLKKTGYSFDLDYPPSEESLPVTGISWEDATAYSAWAHKRLPSRDELSRAFKKKMIKETTYNEWAADQQIFIPLKNSLQSPTSFRCAY